MNLVRMGNAKRTFCSLSRSGFRLLQKLWQAVRAARAGSRKALTNAMPLHAEPLTDYAPDLSRRADILAALDEQAATLGHATDKFTWVSTLEAAICALDENTALVLYKPFNDMRFDACRTGGCNLPSLLKELRKSVKEMPLYFGPNRLRLDQA